MNTTVAPQEKVATLLEETTRARVAAGSARVA